MGKKKQTSEMFYEENEVCEHVEAESATSWKDGDAQCLKRSGLGYSDVSEARKLAQVLQVERGETENGI